LASDHAIARAPSNLTLRVVSALVLVPIAIAAAVLGGAPFALFVALVATLGFWEWTALTPAHDPLWPRLVGVACLAMGLLALSLALTDWAIGLIALPAFASLLAGYRSRSLRWLGLGLVYVAVPCAALIMLREAETGLSAILFIFLAVWAADIGGYFGGRQFGGPKLWPRVSPKKTWSGALIGSAAAAMVGAASAWAASGNPITGVLLAVPLSAAAQAGDLLESAVKRHFGAKDSGQLIPGHGGVLDRVDGLFGAAALAWLLAGVGLGGGILALPPDIVAMSGGTQ
jgi:phosphatidate cytidylyltransferase